MKGGRIGTSIVAGLMVIPALVSTLAWAEGFVDSSAWVEGLDAGQRTIGERYVWVLGSIPPSNRIYFVAESVPGAASYRISVSSYDLMTGGGQ